ASEIVVLVNGISQAFTYNESTDILTSAVSLEEGSNEIIITATNACGSDEEKIRVSRTIPCDDIVTNFLSPVSGTATATESTYSILLNASGLTDVSQISVTLNGAPQSVSFDDVTGNIVIDGLTLVDGTNTVVVSLNNGCSTATVNYTINFEECKTPVITINGIYDGQTLSASAGMFTAILANVNSVDDITLTLNGLALDFTFDETSGILQANFLLNDGANVFVITINGCETVSKTINVVFVEPCEDITYGLITPTSVEQTVVDPAYAINLSATGIESSSQIGVTQNGSNIPFTFDAGTKIISISGITLVDGANGIAVTLKNDCSNATVTYTINYDGCKPPVITIPSMATVVDKALYTFTATVTNIASASELEFLLNGAPQPFVFDPSTGVFQADVILTEGMNTFSLTAKGCETKSANASLTYTIPCEPIVYTLGTPSTNTVAVADDIYAIELIIQNTTKDNIKVTVDGLDKAFTYASNLVSISGITLKDGINTVVVSASNDCSSETITYTINHETCSTPAINLSMNSASSSTELYTLQGALENVESASDITLNLNGSSMPFTFASGVLNATLTLVEGTNTIEVIVDGCDKATQSISVLYEIPCVPLTYTLVSPNSTSEFYEDDVITITLSTTNIESASDITASLNGVSAPFTFESNIITIADLTLKPGTNEVYVSFKNDCSDEYVIYHLEYIPCTAPAIALNSAPSVSENPYEFSATILNVEKKEDVVITLNGTVLDFVWDPTTFTATVAMTLVDGDNSVKVEASGCE
ncbi:hypothetical protein JYT72_03220, partial [Crocinitomix catalasitica]|nr:hypothetical protein [Crocinitomix catalasitica]